MLSANILVVDDDPFNREILTQALKNEGCTVTAVEDGMQALRLLRGKDHDIDLILLDVMMPDMDGYDVLRIIKGSSETSRLPVVMISALDDVASVAKCLELGADDFLTKPFDATLLRARIDNSLTRERYADTERRYIETLEREEHRSEQLILNILPAAIAKRLRQGEDQIADHHDDVSVLFADIVGFTSLSARRPAGDVVKLLNTMITRFDELAAKHRIEKLRTVGDCYFAAGGLTEPRDEDHLASMIAMAYDMLVTVGELEEPIQVRVGINVGPVIAGVVGIHKFAYDIWGDTVNIASRMESHGVPGRIQITPAVRDRLGDRYVFEERGSIELKNRGSMETFLLVDQRGARRADAAAPRDRPWLPPDELVRGE